MGQRRQFSLRAVFVAVTLCALLSLLWRSRPDPTVQVELTTAGTALVDGEEVTPSSLLGRIDREARYRKIWLMKPVLILHCSPSVSHKDVAEVATQSQRAGFAKLSLTVADER